ncbi:hypothetical protein NI17_015210 [Thermobifida halotolerans]|uniref:Uncharacterized protein n=1 Tax=Thermobifida halotolerans TaxID=483545 RepID=A0A399G3V8_9ACTN|nr:hypothetical protein [Thermobifida halotolerans]UOE18190.1 hypothetical protein NI17_015210 [Thermobifida halotolerans]
MEPNREQPSVDALLEAVDDAWDDADRLRALVRGALDAGFGPEILPAAERVRRLDPDLDRGAVLHALALRGCGRHEQAERELVAHIRARGGHADTWFALVPLAERRGSAADIATALANALRCDPNHAGALVWGWRYHTRQDGLARADRWLAEYAPDSWRATVMLGERALYQEEVERAVELFDAACERGPRRGEPLLRGARALARGGHDAECVELVLSRWSGSRGAEPLMEAIEAQLRLGRVADAVFALARLRGLRDVERDHPEAADLYRRVARARAEAGL